MINLKKKAKLQLFTFRNVSYLYEDKRVLDNININFKLGKSYAIVGTSGSGKLTLIKLIQSYSDKYEGDIFFDSCELNIVEQGDFESLLEKRGEFWSLYNISNNSEE